MPRNLCQTAPTDVSILDVGGADRRAAPQSTRNILIPIARKGERRPLRQHRLRPYWAPARWGVHQLNGYRSQTALARREECCSEPGSGPLLLTLLTLLAVFSRDVRILITLLPARPSRLKAMSMPSVRRNVCARRKWPARARGFLGQPVLCFEIRSLLRS